MVSQGVKQPVHIIITTSTNQSFAKAEICFCILYFVPSVVTFLCKLKRNKELELELANGRNQT